MNRNNNDHYLKIQTTMQTWKEKMTSFKKEPSALSADFETLVAATFYMLTRCNKQRTSQMAQQIIDHLILLLEQPQVKSSTVLRSSISTLLTEWEEKARKSNIECEAGLVKNLVTNH